MKKYRHLLIFPAMLAIVLVMNCFVDPVELAKARRVNNRNRNFAGILATEEPMDALVMGDSESYTSVSPLQIWLEHGIPVYNCGVQGQCLTETYSELSSALKQQKPKIVLLETNLVFRYHGIEKDSQMVLAEQLYQAIPVLRYHSFWKGIFYTDSDKRKEKDWQKGFHLVVDVGGIESEAREEEGTSEVKLAKLNRWYLEKILRLCEEHDVKLVMYSSASTKNYSPQRIAFLEKLAEEYHLDYINVNTQIENIGIDWVKDSYDGGDHLNLSGAQKVTSYIGDILADTYELPDHRGEKVYKRWNKHANKYQERVDRLMEKLQKNAEAAGIGKQDAENAEAADVPQ